MCGIVGLFLKKPELEPSLGRLTSAMLCVMSDRGPDSAGFAVYGGAETGRVKLTLRADGEIDADGLARALGSALSVPVEGRRQGSHVVLVVPEVKADAAREWLAGNHPHVAMVGSGRRMELYKEVGLPESVAERFGLASMTGSHAIGHTRMATESAVTTAGAHPFSTGPDQCLVHNGSLSNHNSVRRRLEREGIGFGTDNDSEVAAGYLTWRMKEGAGLGEALEAALKDLDGFYTFVVGTETGFGVLRDPIACKPACMAETEDYVAFGSEFRALASLPGIDRARIWEPEPATVYFWERPQ